LAVAGARTAMARGPCAACLWRTRAWLTAARGHPDGRRGHLGQRRGSLAADVGEVTMGTRPPGGGWRDGAAAARLAARAAQWRGLRPAWRDGAAPAAARRPARGHGGVASAVRARGLGERLRTAWPARGAGGAVRPGAGPQVAATSVATAFMPLQGAGSLESRARLPDGGGPCCSSSGWQGFMSTCSCFRVCSCS